MCQGFYTIIIGFVQIVSCAFKKKNVFTMPKQSYLRLGYVVLFRTIPVCMT